MKIWYLMIEGQQEGPYNLRQLKGNSRITPDTLVWREGWKEWVPAGRVPELNSLFEEEEQILPEEEEVELTPEGELTLEMRQKSPFTIFFFVVAMLLFLYILYSWYGP